MSDGFGTSYFHDRMKAKAASINGWTQEISVRTQLGGSEDVVLDLIGQVRTECSNLLHLLADIAARISEQERKR